MVKFEIVAVVLWKLILHQSKFPAVTLLAKAPVLAAVPLPVALLA